jgi:hypothetical protein
VGKNIAGARKLLMGSVAERRFPAACLVAPVGPNVPCKENGEGQFRKMLFATDFSKESLAALPYAFSLAEEDQSQVALLVALLHAMEQPAAVSVDEADGFSALVAINLLRTSIPGGAEVEVYKSAPEGLLSSLTFRNVLLDSDEVCLDDSADCLGHRVWAGFWS